MLNMFTSHKVRSRIPRLRMFSGQSVYVLGPLQVMGINLKNTSTRRLTSPDAWVIK